MLATDHENRPALDPARTSTQAGIVVMKFGGTPVSNPERLRAVAAQLAAAHGQGKRVVGVLSAMGHSTDELLDLGHDAISLTGSQAGIVTDTVHGKAKIVEVRGQRIREALDSGKIVLVAGLHVRSTFTGADGTWIVEGDERMLEKAMISGVAHTFEETLYRVNDVAAARLFSALAAAQVNVDTIVQTGPEIVFTAPAADRLAATEVLGGLGVQWSATDDLGKVSVIGAGMKSHPGIAAKTFSTLEAIGIQPKIVSTSPIKIACHVERDEVERAVNALHEAFELGVSGSESRV